MKTKFLTLAFACATTICTVHAAGKLPAPKNFRANVKTLSAASVAALTKNIEYATAKPDIRDSYHDKLDELAKAIKNDNYAVSLRGHADAIGGYKYNWVLSDQRAISVKEYLISKGVKAESIITTPFGSTVPIASNKTPEGRQKNRRVEIRLKKIS